MANTLTGSRENLMSKMTQKYLERAFTYPKVASFKEDNTLTKGAVVSRPYKSDFVPAAYTANSDVTATDITMTQETLTVDQSYAASFKIDPVEQKQSFFNLEQEYAPRLAHKLGNLIDRDFNDEHSNAALDLDDGDFGGTTGSPIDLSSVNAEKVFNDAYAELVGNNIGSGGLYTIVDPKIISQINQRGLNLGFNVADITFNNGFTGNKFAGFDVYVSNNLPSTIDLTYSATGATAKDFKINGVTFHQVTTIGTTAGNVLMETDATTCATNVKNFLNDLGTTSAKQVALSTTNKDKLEYAGISASSSAGVVTITAYGRMTTTIDTGANASFGNQTVYATAGQYGAVDMVVQMQPSIQINKATNNLGSTILGHTLWGTKTFIEGTERLLELNIQG